MIEQYLHNYWSKYPNEKLTDPSLSSIQTFLENGGLYFCSGRLLGLYVDEGYKVRLLVYWCDLEGLSPSELRDTVRLHKATMAGFSKPVVSAKVKPIFNRKYLGHYESDEWRWL